MYLIYGDSTLPPSQSHTGDSTAEHVGQLPAALEAQDHGESFGGKVENGADDKLEVETAGQLFPGERDPVHDEGGGEPVEVEDQSLDAENGVGENLPKASLGGGGSGLPQLDLFRLNRISIKLPAVGQDFLRLRNAASKNTRFFIFDGIFNFTAA